MEAIIALVIAVIGCKFCDMDFCTLFTFISTPSFCIKTGAPTLRWSRNKYNMYYLAPSL